MYGSSILFQSHSRCNKKRKFSKLPYCMFTQYDLPAHFAAALLEKIIPRRKKQLQSERFLMDQILFRQPPIIGLAGTRTFNGCSRYSMFYVLCILRSLFYVFYDLRSLYSMLYVLCILYFMFYIFYALCSIYSIFYVLCILFHVKYYSLVEDQYSVLPIELPSQP